MIALFIVSMLEAAEPLYEPVPSPLQELSRYWTPVPPEMGVVTPKVADAPESYQPEPVGEPKEDITVK